MKEYVKLRERDGEWSVLHYEDFGGGGVNITHISSDLPNREAAHEIALIVKAQRRFDTSKYLLG